MRVLGVEPYLTAYGLYYQSLLIFALVFGMGGSFISLALSKWTAKRISGAKRRGLTALFATHPDLDDRITALHGSAYPDYR